MVRALGPLTRDMFITGGSFHDYQGCGLPHVADQFETQAALVGIFSALAAARHDYCLVAACDLPFASLALGRLLARLAPGHDAAMPATEKGPEPLFALYHKRILPHLLACIEGSRLAVRPALEPLDVRLVAGRELARVCDPALALFNMNTAERLAEARRLAAAGAVMPPGVFDLPGGACCDPDTRHGSGRGSRHHTDGDPPLVCFVGKKDSGKTTFLENLLPRLRARGLRVACIKHDIHGFQMDREGTDTWRLAQAGAREVAISSPAAVATLSRPAQELTLADLYDRVRVGADIVIAEGFKHGEADRIEVSRRARSTSLACSEADLLAVVSDRPGAAAAIPQFALDDFDGVAAFLVERYFTGRELGAAS